MKKSIVLLMVAMMNNVTSLSAKVFSPRKNYASTTQELVKLLNSPSSIGIVENDVQVVVEVVVNNTGELMVLQTSTDNVDLANYIKENLNYKKLSSGELTEGKGYAFAVNF